MVRRQDDRQQHHQRHQHRYRARDDMTVGLEQRQPHQQDPPEVEARDGCELVHQVGALERLIHLRVVPHGVDESELREHARRRDRHRREDDQPHRARQQERIAIPGVKVVVADIQVECGDADHRQVAPDVDPVEQRDEPVMVDDERL